MVRILRFSLIIRSLFAAVVLLIGCTPGYTAGTRRVALLIANTTYTNTTPLPNPDRDVKLIASKLSELGFEVTLESDLDAKKISAAMIRFTQSLDKNTDALFYYAGHGLQLLGENYLVGIDAELKSEALLQFETFKLNSVLGMIEARAGTSLIFWDACRSNPLATELVSSLSARAPPAGQGRTREGAAPLPPRRGDTLVVFSAEPGKLAMDGAPGNYSPFAHALAQHITAANVEIEGMLKRVTADVLKATRDYQRPERLSQLTGEFYSRREGQAKLIEEQELSKLRER